MNKREFENTFRSDTKIWQVYSVLRDQQWHCRACEYEHVQSTQIAGGGGIQGLQRGNQSRPGMVIVSGDHLCVRCDKMTRQDRWTGGFEEVVTSSSMPREFVRRAMSVLGHRDVVEGTERPANQLTLDHKLPMIRWSADAMKMLTDFRRMSDRDIQTHFQLLKKSNGSVSHNLLKSRACERCYKSGLRGTPFAISYYYEGDSRWQPAEKNDPSGCIGCGWYDFDRWRRRLNQALRGDE